MVQERCIEKHTSRQGTKSYRLELSDIFREYGDEYRSWHKLSPKQHSVMFDIEHCRTSKLGYHVNACTECGHTEHAYNSCRNRHCPKCQGISQRKWVRSRLKNLLPIPYYHVVFTLTHKIFPISLYNQKVFYDLLFDCAAQTLLQFGKDPRHLGGLIGFYGILHTWGGQMWQHPHLHFIVSGGGLNSRGQWVEPKYKGRFLFPVRAVSKVFRGKFIQGLKSAYYDGQLTFPEDYSYLKDSRQFESWIDTLVEQDWVVYAKKPFAGPEKIVRYIGRYTHRVAISNARLISMKAGQVKFKYKNYRKKRWEEICLSAEEFIRRFLMHVLPEKFHRIRHYGFFANGKCKEAVRKIRKQLTPCAFSVEDSSEGEITRNKCQVCMKGIMIPMLAVTRFGTTVFRTNMALYCF